MSELAIRLEGLGKRYKIFPRRRHHLMDAFGLTRAVPWLDAPHHDFWALRGIDLELPRGERIGVIGRNGAGKTTLLKLITGNLAPTEGTVEVRGEVQALLDVGGGFHPEFTGRENVRAALTYQGLDNRDIGSAEKEIEQFTELGEFFDQPFKTYSLGMQARLTFACATSIRPEILIVDEILGAGDAHFYRRSVERMRELMHGGATVLLVSHALQQIQRFCDQTIWLEKGTAMMLGSTVEVVKAYEKFTRELDEQWMRESSQAISTTELNLSEWTDLPGIRIVSVRIESADGIDRNIFNVGDETRIRVLFRAVEGGRFPVRPVVLITRPDGLIMTRHIGAAAVLDLDPGDEYEAVLDLERLQLGNGDYLLSAGIWRDVDPQHIEPSNYYHHLDRSFRLRVVGNPPMHDELFVHPGRWRLTRAQPAERTSG